MSDNKSQERVEATINLSASVKINSKSRFSNRHIRCACLCAKECDKIEREYEVGDTLDDYSLLYEEDHAYASGSIISSVAYLESTINEFYSDCCDKADFLKEIDHNILISLGSKWDCDDFEKKNLLLKYELALMEITGKGFGKGVKEYYDVNDLIKLRNLLVHYKAYWQGDTANESKYKVNHLSKKFDSNPFMKKTGNPFFPYKCLGKGCALWGIKTSIDFVAYFYEKIGVKSLIDADSIYLSVFK
ncbi:hypothetical protein [uncultured Methanomethylovorans sp.]|uniref:hypothetical protein n=1 Tax=uncultured Methanomethylovorans sp. TaxID=183759 RepID=UPI002AA93BE4|nr:hypothetical protein [uncultured Methanomethylovorans sp.]